MIITISGKPGSGKTTVGNMLAKHLGYDEYDIGIFRREMARRRGMTIAEYNTFGETNPITDTEADEYQRELGQTRDNFVVQGRTSFHFIPHSIKLFLDVDTEVGAKRIWKDLQSDPDKRNEGKYASLQEVIDSIPKRIASDTKRYQQYYSIDVSDKSHYDLWLDTSEMTAQQTFDAIVEFLHTSYPQVFLDKK